jgi:hypothetical protein
MTRIEQLEQSWRNLEADVSSKLRKTNARSNTYTERRCRERDPKSKFPSLPSSDETIERARAAELASTLDLIHTAMRELGLRYD